MVVRDCLWRFKVLQMKALDFRRILAAAGALFSLWWPVANNVDFGLHFGVILGARLNYTHVGVSLSRFWVAKWGVVLKVTF